MNLKEQIRAIFAIVWFDGVIPIRRSPFNLVNFIVSPLTILFFIYIFAGASKVVFALGGGLIAVIVGSCIVLETEAAFIRLVVRLQDMFVSSPLSPVSYVVGLSVAQLFNGAAGIVLFSVLLAFDTHLDVISGLEIAFAAVITWSLVSALGFMISTFARDVRDLWVYSPLLNVVLSFLPPVFYPITVIPQNLRFIAYIAPTTYPAGIIQAATGLVSTTPQQMLAYFAGGIVYTLILVGLAVRLSKWRQD
ncbi:MAG: ABC transporter permease [Nitrososphaerota archaeon]|nr:ABC transporter permease [Nitrososphaerota archaeon]